MNNESQNGLYYLLVLILFFGVFFGIGSWVGPLDEKIFDLETAGDEHSPTVVKTSKKKKKKPKKEDQKEPAATETVGTLSNAMKTDLKEKMENDSMEILTDSIRTNTTYKSGVVVRYYKKELDENKVLSLADLGFYVHERPTSKELSKFQSNAIYYGDSVKREDIITIAKHLTQQGIDIKLVEHSRYGGGWKSHSIEIGVDSTFIDKPTLTQDEITTIVNENPYIKD